MGFTAQLISWPDGFCDMLAGHGFHVIRFDNRDSGLSTTLDGVVPDVDGAMAAAFAGTPAPEVPYTLSDMAADSIGLLDHLGISTAHIVGASMGGMIAQTIAIEHPTRTLSLTSIMSMTGEVEFGSPMPEAAAVLLAPPPTERAAYIEKCSLDWAIWSSKRYFDAEETRGAGRSLVRPVVLPRGVEPPAGRHLRERQPRRGSRCDHRPDARRPRFATTRSFLPPVATAQRELVPGASMLYVADMGHDLPAPLWPLITGAIAATARL